MQTAIVRHKIIVNSPIEFSKILDIRFDICGNMHGQMIVCGCLPVKCAEQQVTKSFEGQILSISILDNDESKNGTPVFCGTVSKIDIEKNYAFYNVEVTVSSATALLDITPKSRSFQNVEMTFREVVNSVLVDTKDAWARFAKVANEPIKKPIIQYQETDWQFIMRLASMLGLQLFPDCTTPFPTFSFGYEVGDSAQLISNSYSVLLDQRYFEQGGSEKSHYKPDFLCYSVSSYQCYNLGKTVVFQDLQLFLYKVSGCLTKGELLFDYKAVFPGFCIQKEILNKKLIGLALPGVVTKTQIETVNIALDIDKGHAAGSFPFPWTPESGDIMYCMPKIGTRILLIMMDCDMGHSVVISSPRENGDNCPSMEDPQMRCFTTEHGKIMGLYPENTYFSAGAENEVLFINIDDINGIIFESTQPIEIIAKNDIVFNAPEFGLVAEDQLRALRSPSYAKEQIEKIVSKGTKL